MSSSAERYPCPCCGYHVFDGPPGSYDICPICFWEDDAAQLRYADMAGGANSVSLREAQRTYATLRVQGRQPVWSERKPTPTVQRDVGWRPLDPGQDDIEPSPGEAAPAEPWPDDLATLYYWRDTYWRR